MIINNNINNYKNLNKNNPLNFNRKLTKNIIKVKIFNISFNNNPPNINNNNNNNNIRIFFRLKSAEFEN